MGMVLSLWSIPQNTLDAYLENSALLEEDIYEKEQWPTVYLDKSWAGILYLLNGVGMGGAGTGLSRLLLSGDLVDEEQDLGYGPAHYLCPMELKEHYSEIADWTEEDLRQRYDAKDMQAKDVYPSQNWADEQNFEYLANYFKLLQEFYVEAVAKGQAIISVIS